MDSDKELYVSEAEKAYKIIHEAIISGKYAPGTKLSRRKMADFTNVSVIPVIEALKQLESEGLVESQPKWGSYVMVPTRKKLDDQYMLRETIECRVAELLAERGLMPEQEALLRSYARKVDDRIPSEKRQASHYDFHIMLAQFTGYDCFTDLLKRINLFTILCRAMNSRRRESDVPSDWHERIIDAVVSGDSVRAKEVMRDHVYDSYKIILKEIDEFTARYNGGKGE
ncbi:MAG: GntR family transcriptional regulator [Treponema sp.]|jgi:DNA-binding GntR family transcriptional regulator|nr:GntR family transcriptional regulator [Treponema sp.]